MPEIDRIAKDASVPFLAVAVTGQPAAAVEKSAGLQAATVVIAGDATLEALGVEDVPTTLILADGRPVGRINGEIDPSDLPNRLRQAATTLPR